MTKEAEKKRRNVGEEADLKGDSDALKRTVDEARVVYTAENNLPRGTRFSTLSGAEDYAHLVSRFDPYLRGMAISAIYVDNDAAPARAICYADRGELYLPEWALTQLTVLHEMAHLRTTVATGTDGAHGPEFIRHYRELLHAWHPDAEILLDHHLRC